MYLDKNHNEFSIARNVHYFLNMCLDCGPDPRIMLFGGVHTKDSGWLYLERGTTWRHKDEGK